MPTVGEIVRSVPCENGSRPKLKRTREIVGGEGDHPPPAVPTDEEMLQDREDLVLADQRFVSGRRVSCVVGARRRVRRERRTPPAEGQPSYLNS